MYYGFDHYRSEELSLPIAYPHYMGAMLLTNYVHDESTLSVLPGRGSDALSTVFFEIYITQGRILKCGGTFVQLGW